MRSKDVLRPEPTVGELGESAVLRRVLAELGAADAALIGPGDDCAIVAVAGDLAVTSDTMIEGPDFRLAWHSGYELGWKLAATNLSDVAAMGARPVGLTVSLAMPGDTPAVLLAEIARGLDAACRTLAPGCGVVGGDLGRAPVLFAAVTALGEQNGRAPVTRDGARPGDIVAYAGDLGLAGMGLALLFAECADSDGTAHDRGLERLRAEHSAEISAQLAPQPPVTLGAVAAEAGATAMMDVSDSLSLDAARLAVASGCMIALETSLLESHFGRQRGVSVSNAAMLTGGEDHGLLATFPSGASLPAGFMSIGEVRAQVSGGEGSPLVVDDTPFAPRGWDPYTVLPPGS